MDAFGEKTLPQFTLADVRHHETPESLWMIIYNKVYDVTSLPRIHPGGAEVLLDCGGVDATDAFEDVGHSKNAFDMLRPFLVGTLVEGDAKKYGSARAEKDESCVSCASPSNEKRNPNAVVRDHQPVIWILVILALFACLAIVCLQRLKWANLVS